MAFSPSSRDALLADFVTVELCHPAAATSRKIAPAGRLCHERTYRPASKYLTRFFLNSRTVGRTA